MVQKTIIGTLHKEGKSQRVIAERTGYSQSAVSKHIKCKVDWKEVISEEKLHKLTASLRLLSSKADSVTRESFTRSELKLESSSHQAQISSGKGLPSHFWSRNNIRSTLPGLRRRRTGLLLSGPKSSFQMRASFIFHLETKFLESGGRVEKLLEVQW